MADCSTSGATTRTSPKRAATRARASNPGLKIPSSFDTNILIWLFVPLPSQRFFMFKFIDGACTVTGKDTKAGLAPD
jgi:hypothetical protein